MCRQAVARGRGVGREERVSLPSVDRVANVPQGLREGSLPAGGAGPYFPLMILSISDMNSPSSVTLGHALTHCPYSLPFKGNEHWKAAPRMVRSIDKPSRRLLPFQIQLLSLEYASKTGGLQEPWARWVE